MGVLAPQIVNRAVTDPRMHTEHYSCCKYPQDLFYGGNGVLDQYFEKIRHGNVSVADYEVICMHTGSDHYVIDYRLAVAGYSLD